MRLGLQVVARLDAVDFRYSGGSRGGVGGAASADGRYAAYDFDAGVNFWATKHLRFSLNYLYYFFPSQAVMGMANPTEDNHLHGPHLNQGDYGEITARVGLAL